MPSAPLRLADLESLLRARKLGATLPGGFPGPHTDAAAVGVPALDAALGGGLARGHVSELVGAASSGRGALLCRLLAQATASLRNEVVALVDAFDTFDPETAAAAGVDLTRLLWIRGSFCDPRLPPSHEASADRRSLGGGGQPGRAVQNALDRAIKAVALVLQAGGFGVVALDVASAPPRALARVPFTTWLRIQRLVDGRSTACVLVTPVPLGRTPGGVTLTLEPVGRWSGTAPRARLFRGLDVNVRLTRTRMTREEIVQIKADV